MTSFFFADSVLDSPVYLTLTKDGKVLADNTKTTRPLSLSTKSGSLNEALAKRVTICFRVRGLYLAHSSCANAGVTSQAAKNIEASNLCFITRENAELGIIPRMCGTSTDLVILYGKECVREFAECKEVKSTSFLALTNL